jgi:hypothetical protein
MVKKIKKIRAMKIFTLGPLLRKTYWTHLASLYIYIQFGTQELDP